MRTIPLFLLALPLTSSLWACGGRKAEPAANVAAAFVPPAVQAPPPIAGQANGNPITAYVGKYPGDAVGGVGFYDRSEVATALIDAVGDRRIRRLMTAREATSVPIFTINGRIAAHGCEPHDCGNHNWTFLIRPDGTDGEACYHEAAMGGSSHWYAGAAPRTRPGACPAA